MQRADAPPRIFTALRMAVRMPDTEGNMVSPIARQLADERKTVGQSLHDLSERSGYSESFLSKAECGHRNPSFTALQVWAEALGYDVVLQRKNVS